MLPPAPAAAAAAAAAFPSRAKDDRKDQIQIPAGDACRMSGNGLNECRKSKTREGDSGGCGGGGLLPKRAVCMSGARDRGLGRRAKRLRNGVILSRAG